MAYYVYILQSLVDHSYYIGYTQNINQRLDEHNSGKSRYTSKKTPWKLVYPESYSTKKEALQIERFFFAGLILQIFIPYVHIKCLVLIFELTKNKYIRK